MKHEEQNSRGYGNANGMNGLGAWCVTRVVIISVITDTIATPRPSYLMLIRAFGGFNAGIPSTISYRLSSFFSSIWSLSQLRRCDCTLAKASSGSIRRVFRRPMSFIHQAGQL